MFFILLASKEAQMLQLKKFQVIFVPTIMMNTNILEAARFNEVNNLVYTSSIGAYSNSEIFEEKNYSLASEPMDFAGWAKKVS